MTLLSLLSWLHRCILQQPARGESRNDSGRHPVQERRRLPSSSREAPSAIIFLLSSSAGKITTATFATRRSTVTTEDNHYPSHVLRSRRNRHLYREHPRRHCCASDLTPRFRLLNSLRKVLVLIPTIQCRSRSKWTLRSSVL
jgi:hypothetical protein